MTLKREIPTCGDCGWQGSVKDLITSDPLPNEDEMTMCCPSCGSHRVQLELDKRLHVDKNGLSDNTIWETSTL